MTKCTHALSQEVHFYHSMFGNLEFGPLILSFKSLLKIRKQKLRLEKDQISR